MVFRPKNTLFLHKIQNICNTPSKKKQHRVTPMPHNCCQFWPKNAIFVQWCSSKPCPILGAPPLSKVLLFYVNSTESYRISISIWFTMFHCLSKHMPAIHFLITSIAIAAMVNKNTPHTWVFWYFLCQFVSFDAPKISQITSNNHYSNYQSLPRLHPLLGGFGQHRTTANTLRRPSFRQSLRSTPGLRPKRVATAEGCGFCLPQKTVITATFLRHVTSMDSSWYVLHKQ